MDDKITAVYLSHIQEQASLAPHLPLTGSRDQQVFEAAATGLTQGIEEGLALAIHDPEGARLLLDWMHRIIHKGDPEYTSQVIYDHQREITDAVR
jgi:hypothetical protein